MSSAPADEIDTQFNALFPTFAILIVFSRRVTSIVLVFPRHDIATDMILTACSSHVWCGSSPRLSRHVGDQVSACGDAGSCA